MSLTSASVMLFLGCSILREARSWAISNQLIAHQRLTARLSHESILFSSEHEADDSDLLDPTVEKLISTPTTVTYGVSYIGGDPCGSKYNDDPFDASKDVVKPGMPDDMKDRIAALAAKMLEGKDKH
ncbi:hypothetical protein HJC23_003128 [Cyclotella cryptica]|uniref:Uncharacterized protein n=1 Tax=Cyclotella cryptica TaxID=29204 RepID=A0ABD3P5L7_9STRA